MLSGASSQSCALGWPLTSKTKLKPLRGVVSSGMEAYSSRTEPGQPCMKSSGRTLVPAGTFLGLAWMKCRLRPATLVLNCGSVFRKASRFRQL